MSNNEAMACIESAFWKRDEWKSLSGLLHGTANNVLAKVLSVTLIHTVQTLTAKPITALQWIALLFWAEIYIFALKWMFAHWKVHVSRHARALHVFIYVWSINIKYQTGDVWRLTFTHDHFFFFFTFSIDFVTIFSSSFIQSLFLLQTKKKVAATQTKCRWSEGEREREIRCKQRTF